jgi:hypothetical protein
VLSFSCSCLVSFSPSKVGQFNFECCPLAQEISSVIHYLPCFGGALSLCLFIKSSVLGFYSFASPPLSRQVQFSTSRTPLSVLDYSLLFVFQFCGKVQFWVLLSESGDHLCDLFPALLWSGLSPACCQSLLPFLCLFTDSLVLSLAPCPSPFFWCSFSVPPTLSTLYVWLKFIVCHSVLFGGTQSTQGLCWFVFPGVDRGFLHGAWYSPVCSVNWCAGRFGASSEKCC